jgi:hypothetical protein
MVKTTHFQFERPEPGDYFGRWDTPVNSNMKLIDDALWQLITCNQDKTQAQINALGVDGILRYDGPSKSLTVKIGADFVSMLTSDSLYLTSYNRQH